jgi:Uma2 family endonuclease
MQGHYAPALKGTQMTIEKTFIAVDFSREYTAEEYALLEDDGNIYELIEGKLVMAPLPNDEHSTIADELLSQLKFFLKANPGIGKAWSNTGFNVGKKPNGKDNILGPDVGFIVASRVPPVSRNYLPYPDLAAEVWSEESDLGRPSRLQKARQKLQIYLENGTRIAWGINPIKQEVEVYHQGQPDPVKILGLNDQLDGEDVIPGFTMPVADLFK